MFRPLVVLLTSFRALVPVLVLLSAWHEYGASSQGFRTSGDGDRGCVGVRCGATLDDQPLKPDGGRHACPTRMSIDGKPGLSAEDSLATEDHSAEAAPSSIRKPSSKKLSKRNLPGPAEAASDVDNSLTTSTALPSNRSSTVDQNSTTTGASPAKPKPSVPAVTSLPRASFPGSNSTFNLSQDLVTSASREEVVTENENDNVTEYFEYDLTSGASSMSSPVRSVLTVAGVDLATLLTRPPCPCRHGGSCVEDDDDNIKCSCPHGFSGKLCQDVDDRLGRDTSGGSTSSDSSFYLYMIVTWGESPSSVASSSSPSAWPVYGGTAVPANVTTEMTEVGLTSRPLQPGKRIA